MSHCFLDGTGRKLGAFVVRERVEVDINPLKRKESLGPQGSREDVETRYFPVPRELPLGVVRATTLRPVFDPELKRTYGVSKLVEISPRYELSLVLERWMRSARRCFSRSSASALCRRVALRAWSAAPPIAAIPPISAPANPLMASDIAGGYCADMIGWSYDRGVSDGLASHSDNQHNCRGGERA